MSLSRFLGITPWASATILLIVGFAVPAHSAQAEAPPDAVMHFGEPTQQAPQPEVEQEPGVSLGTVASITGATAAVTTGIVVGGALAWWRDDGITGWSWSKHDTFFAKDAYAGGEDLTGHFYALYSGTRFLVWLYHDMLGLSHRQSVVVATLASFFLGNLVEVLDGFTEYGFEYPDVLANTMGVGTAALLELSPTLDSLISVRMVYVPSRRFWDNEKNYIKLVNDYSGLFFHLNFKFAGLEDSLAIPIGALRYLHVGVGYGTVGYQPKGAPTKRRNLGVSVGLDLHQIYLEAFQADTPAEAAVRWVNKYYALPFTNATLTRDLNHGQWAVNFGVPNRLQLSN